MLQCNNRTYYSAYIMPCLTLPRPLSYLLIAGCCHFPALLFFYSISYFQLVSQSSVICLMDTENAQPILQNAAHAALPPLSNYLPSDRCLLQPKRFISASQPNPQPVSHPSIKRGNDHPPSVLLATPLSKLIPSLSALVPFPTLHTTPTIAAPGEWGKEGARSRTKA